MAESVSLPIILYNVPSRTGLNIDIKTLKKLAKVDNIVAIKEASGNISYVAQVAAECPELDIYSGNDDMIVPIMSLGGKGVISVLSNVAPEETHDMCEKYLNGDLKGSLELQLKLLNLVKALFIEVNPIPVKTALNLMGMNAGLLRMPLYEMEEGNLEFLKSAMKEVGIL
jgi:4-hydroxy-tetrahydrodipicolinate synthase